MKNIIIIIFIALAAAVYAHAKEPMFKALSVAGKAEYESGGSWRKLSPGKELFNGDKIKLDKRAVVGLAYLQGGILQLKDNGVYDVSNLKDKVKKSKISDKLASYIMENIKETDEIIARDDYQNRMSVTGATQRGKGAFKVELLQPAHVNIFCGKVSFEWSPNVDIDEYDLVFIDFADREIYKMTLSDSVAHIVLKETNLARGVNYIWTVVEKGDKINDENKRIIKWASESEKEKIKEEIMEIKAQFGEEGPLTYLSLATLFDQYEYIYDANKYYEKLVQSAPEVEEYKNMHSAFKFRRKID